MRTPFCVVIAMLIASCGGDDANDQDQLPEGIVQLTLDDDGAERGKGMTSAVGVVEFYSERHHALLSLDLGDSAAMVVAGVEVEVEATETGVTYYAHDPAGRFMPMLFSTAIPQGLDEELQVKGADLLGAADSSPRRIGLTDHGPRPSFEPRSKPFLVGLLVSMNIRAFMVGIGEAAAIMALTSIVTNTCTFFAPLHDDMCGTVGKIVDLAATVATGGVKLVLGKGFGWTAAILKTAWTEAWSELRSQACEAAGKMMVGWIQPPPDAEKTVQRRYREAAYNYRFLLDKLDTAPPADPVARAALKAQLVDAGVALSGIAGKVRDHYYEIYNAEDSSDLLLNSSFKLTSLAIKKLVEVRPIILQSITLTYGYYELLVATSTSVSYERFDFMLGKLDLAVGEKMEVPWKAEWGLDCAMAVAKSAKIKWDENGSAQEAEVDVETAVGHMIEILDLFVEDLHREHYGGSIPTPDCLPDIWEVNDTWQSSLASPFAGTLGTGVVTLEGVNLCNGTSAMDEDWFTFDAAPINFNVEARIRKPATGTGGAERVCLDLFWYSQISELSDSPPYALPGAACGTVDSEFSTNQVNVAQSTGEAYRYVMARVRPDPSVTPVPAVGIDYTLTFTH